MNHGVRLIRNAMLEMVDEAVESWEQERNQSNVRVCTKARDRIERTEIVEEMVLPFIDAMFGLDDNNVTELLEKVVKRINVLAKSERVAELELEEFNGKVH